MNEQQRLHLVQARSDWEIYQFLQNKHTCHRLHYLQMTTEKLAKAYFWARPGAETIGHAAFVSFLLSISTNRQVARSFHFPSTRSLRQWMLGITDLANQLESLAPSLTDGPNPEYLWPRSLPVVAPIEHDFDILGSLNARNGINLLRMIEQCLKRFEEWF